MPCIQSTAPNSMIKPPIAPRMASRIDGGQNVVVVVFSVCHFSVPHLSGVSSCSVSAPDVSPRFKGGIALGQINFVECIRQRDRMHILVLLGSRSTISGIDKEGHGHLRPVHPVAAPARSKQKQSNFLKISRRPNRASRCRTPAPRWVGLSGCRPHRRPARFHRCVTSISRSTGLNSQACRGLWRHRKRIGDGLIQNRHPIPAQPRQ